MDTIKIGPESESLFCCTELGHPPEEGKEKH